MRPSRSGWGDVSRAKRPGYIRKRKEAAFGRVTAEGRVVGPLAVLSETPKEERGTLRFLKTCVPLTVPVQGNSGGMAA